MTILVLSTYKDRDENLFLNPHYIILHRSSETRTSFFEENVVKTVKKNLNKHFCGLVIANTGD